MYSKVTIPVALACLEKGWKVTFQVNRPNFLEGFLGFSEDKIKNNPTGVTIQNKKAFDFISELIGLQQQWGKNIDKINFSMFAWLQLKKYDAVIGATKNMKLLSRIVKKGIPTYALGYQHFPVFVDLSNKKPSYDKYESSSIFFNTNSFSEQHEFNKIISGYTVKLNTFTFLDAVHSMKKELKNESKVLIFHPGGYRNVITSFGDGKSVCIEAQKKFIKRVCLPLIKEGLIPVIKVHPFRANYHDIEDLSLIINNIESEESLKKGSIELIGPKGWFWDIAFSARFILTFGSSSIYELWSAGLDNVYVCDFEGKERSKKFKFLDSIMINTYEEYKKFVSLYDNDCHVMDELSSEIYDEYHSFFSGRAVENVVSWIE